MNWHESVIPFSLAVLSLLLLSGCNKDEGNLNLEPAARVNGQVVAVKQVEMELEKMGQIPADQAQSLANRILKNVVDQELLSQQTGQTKLDQQPDVQMKLAAARRQILAEAQIAALTKDMANPGEAEIKAYFDSHPELFGKRRIYKLQELIAGTTPDNIDSVREMADQAKSPRELAAALQAKGIQVGAREVVKGAEDLPSELLAKLSEMKEGQSLTQIQGSKLNMVILAATELRPIGFDQASPMIVRYLANASKRERVEAELDKLKAKAKIEYTPPYGEVAGPVGIGK